MKHPFLTAAIAALGFVIAGRSLVWAEIKFIPLVDASLALNSASYDADYATAQTQETDTQQESTGENVYLYVAPNISFTEVPGLWITPALEFEFTGANNLLQLEDEAFIFQRRTNIYYLLGANYAFNRHWSAKLKGFGRMERAQESADETLENGVYNYNDFGGWGEVSAKYLLGKIPMRSKLGYKAYGRRYPNYAKNWRQEYLDAGGDSVTAAELPEDLDEKDINVNEFWIRQELTWGRMPILTNLEWHMKGIRYTEMPTFNEDGTFSDDLRQDGYMDVYVEFPFLINKYHQLEFDYAYRLRFSNTGYYDTGSHTFIDGYYNYRQNRPRLLYNFKLWFPVTGFLPRGSVSFAWQNRYYYSRPSLQKMDNNGATGSEYKFDDPHWESSLDFSFSLQQQLFTEWFKVFLSFHSISQTSNSNVEDKASYNYKYNTFTLGTAVSF